MQQPKQGFNIDIEAREDCRGLGKDISSSEDRAAIAHVLEHLTQKCRNAVFESMERDQVRRGVLNVDKGSAAQVKWPALRRSWL